MHWYISSRHIPNMCGSAPKQLGNRRGSARDSIITNACNRSRQTSGACCIDKCLRRARNWHAPGQKSTWFLTCHHKRLLPLMRLAAALLLSILALAAADWSVSVSVYAGVNCNPASQYVSPPRQPLPGTPEIRKPPETVRARRPPPVPLPPRRPTTPAPQARVS